MKLLTAHPLETGMPPNNFRFTYHYCHIFIFGSVKGAATLNKLFISQKRNCIRPRKRFVSVSIACVSQFLFKAFLSSQISMLPVLLTWPWNSFYSHVCSSLPVRRWRYWYLNLFGTNCKYSKCFSRLSLSTGIMYVDDYIGVNDASQIFFYQSL